MFPNQDAINRHVYWTDPVLQFFPGTDLQKARLVAPHRIIGVTADIDDEHVVPEPTLTVYSSFDEGTLFGGRLFIHTGANPYALVAPVTRIIRDMSADQPVERAATLADVRAEVLTPDRFNSLVFGVFAAVALAIAVVGVAGVLAFSVSARTREFGIRLALGSEPGRLLRGVIAEGTVNGCGGRPRRRGIRIRAGALGGKIFSGHQDAGRIASICLRVRADGGRGYRVGAARGTRRARQYYAGAALRVTVGRGIRVTGNSKRAMESPNDGPPGLGATFVFGRLAGSSNLAELLVGSAFTDACFWKSPSSFRGAVKCLSAELSELIAFGVPPLDISIGHLKRKAARRGRDDQFSICSGSPYNMGT